MSLTDLVIHPLVVRTAHVVSTEDVDGRTRRVRLEGAELGAFERAGTSHPAFAAPGFDDHIKLIFAADGDVEAALPRQHVDGIEWTPSEHRLTRDYTPHSVDGRTGGFTVDFVLHGDGPAVSWARQATPGSTVSFVGPKSSQVLPDDATSIVLIGDETALPAVRRFLDERPLTVPAHVVVTTGCDGASTDLKIRGTDSIRVELMPEPSGEAIAALFDTGDEAEALGDRPFVWAAGEARSLLPLRRRLAGRVEKSHRSITGYWHIERAEKAGESVPELPESPVAWFAVRAALHTGLLDVLRDRPMSVPDASSALGVQHGLDSLVGTLAAAGLLDGHADGRWALTDLAVSLVDDAHSRDEFTGTEADQVLALRHLADSLRSGTPAWQLDTGLPFAESALTDPEVAHHLEHESESLVFLQHGLRRVLTGLASPGVVAVGPGAGLVARLAHGAGDGSVHVEVDGERGDVVVSAMLLSHLDDQSALQHLRDLSDMAGRAMVIDSSTPDGLSQTAADQGLLRFVTTGCDPRTQDRVGELARAAGWTARQRHTLGWGVVADEFIRDDDGASRQ
ncbi:siderophore-interacting protein [Dietzia sp. NPDC055343]